MPVPYFFRAALFAFGVLVCCSCAPKRVNTFVLTPGADIQLCRIAVLPFQNESDEPSGGALVSNVFRNALIRSAQFEVVGEGEVKRFLLRNRILVSELFDSPGKRYGELGKDLVVDAVVRGKVIDIGDRRVGREGVIPHLNIQVELIDTSTGRPVLSSFHRRKGDDFRSVMHFGIIRTRSRLMAQVADEIIEEWEKQGVTGCE